MNSEMEICGGQSRNGGVWNFLSQLEHSTLTSRHCIPTQNTLWSKYLWIYIDVSRNRLIDWIIGHWWLLSLAVTFPLPRAAEEYKPLFSSWSIAVGSSFTERFSSRVSRNHHMTY